MILDKDGKEIASGFNVWTGTKTEYASATSIPGNSIVVITDAEDTNGMIYYKDSDGNDTPLGLTMDQVYETTTGYGTPNTSYITNGSTMAPWKKVGRVVQLDVSSDNATVSIPTGGWTDMIGDLPKPIQGMHVNNSMPQNNVWFILNENGVLSTYNTGSTADTDMYLHITYISAE